MSLTKDIAYTQNVQIPLGYLDEITAAPDTIVRCEFQLLNDGHSKMSNIQFPETLDTVSIFYGQESLDENIVGVISVKGPAADVNTVLNSAFYINQLYDANLVEQVSTTQDPTLPEDRKGELQIQIPAGVNHGLNVGQKCRISTCNLDTSPEGEFLVTAMDDLNSPTRLWLVYVGSYDIADLYYQSNYKLAAIGAMLQTTGNVDIAPIIDLAYINPHGYLAFPVVVYQDSDNAVLQSGYIIPSGTFFAAEPQFSVLPPPVVYASEAGAWTGGLHMGQIYQQQENYQTVQLLIKRYPNDPNYAGGGDLQQQGDAIENKAKLSTPDYITDISVGVFGTTQVGERISKSYNTGVVRWEFYGTPAECNEALNKVAYFRPPTLTGTYQIETRIVNGFTRIYNTRGAE